VSGKVLLSDTDLKELHAVSYKQIGGSADQGMFSAAVTADTTGSGAGELTWQYVIQNSKIAAEGNGTHTFDIAITDGRGGIVHQAVAITDYACNPNATPALSSPATLMAQSGTTASQSGSFVDANFAAHHTLSVTSLDQVGTDWGQLSATLIQDSAWPTPGMGSYTLSYVPDAAALDALQDGQSHVEHWLLTLAGDNGKFDSKTVTVAVGRPPNQTAVDPSASTISGLLVADTLAEPLYGLMPTEDTPNLPHLFLNATRARDGRRLIMSPLYVTTLPAAGFDDWHLIDYRNGPPWSAAAGTSARFPFISPPGTFTNLDVTAVPSPDFEGRTNTSTVDISTIPGRRHSSRCIGSLAISEPTRSPSSRRTSVSRSSCFTSATSRSAALPKSSTLLLPVDPTTRVDRVS